MLEFGCRNPWGFFIGTFITRPYPPSLLCSPPSPSWRGPYPWASTSSAPTPCHLGWSPGVWSWEDLGQLNLPWKIGVPSVLERLWSSWWPLGACERCLWSKKTYYRIPQTQSRGPPMHLDSLICLPALLTYWKFHGNSQANPLWLDNGTSFDSWCKDPIDRKSVV